MDTLGAFGTSLWSVIDRATDPNTHPKASGDYDPWRRPDPRRELLVAQLPLCRSPSGIELGQPG